MNYKIAPTHAPSFPPIKQNPTLEDCRELLKPYTKAHTNAQALGCVEFVVESRSIEAHYASLQTALKMTELTAYNLIFVRKAAEYENTENGERVYTRLFFGVYGVSLTPTQWSHLNDREED